MGSNIAESIGGGGGVDIRYIHLLCLITSPSPAHFGYICQPQTHATHWVMILVCHLYFGDVVSITFALFIFMCDLRHRTFNVSNNVPIFCISLPALHSFFRRARLGYCASIFVGL